MLKNTNTKIFDNKLYDAIIKQLPYPVFLKNNNLKYILCNEAYSKFFSLKPKDIIGKSDYDLYSDEFAQKYRNDDLEVLRTGKTLELEESFPENNEVKTVFTIKAPIKNEKGNIIAVVGYFKDVTDQRNIENQLKESESRYRLLFNNAGVQIKYLDTDGRVTLINESAAQQFGGKPEDFIGKTPYDMYDEKTASKMTQTIKYILKTGKSFEEILELNYPELGPRVIWSRVLPVKTNNEEILGIQIISQDITKIKESEKALKESEQRFKTLFYEDQAIKLLIDPISGNIIEANNAASQFYGYSNSRFKKINILEINILNKGNLKDLMKNAREKEQNKFQFQHKLANGVIKDVLVYSTPINLNGKKVLCSTIHDITQEKKAMKALKENERKFRNIFNHSNDGMIITDKNGIILDINKKGIELLAYDKEELKNTDINKLINHKKDIQFKDSELRTKQNQIIPIEVNKSYLCYSKEMNVLWIIRDIRERKNIEKQILAATIETENKERKQISEELHDDLAPLLSSIKYYTNLLKKMDEGAKKEEILQLIQELTQESINLTKNISGNLNPDLLINYGLKYALESYCEKIKKERIIKFQLSSFDNLDYVRKENQIILYRIIKELINNTIKHANAHTIILKVTTNEDNLKIIYIDDGVGFDFENEIEKVNNKMGLLNMLNRIKTLNGNYKTTSPSKSGFYIEITFRNDQLT